MTLHTYPPNQCPYKVSTSYTLQFVRYSPDKIFKLKVTTATSKIKSRSHHHSGGTVSRNQNQLRGFETNGTLYACLCAVQLFIHEAELKTGNGFHEKLLDT